ncbi:MAG: LysR substrate-binding domain-containing protein, partial [Propionibacteriales bacterium]|nr:LysR substrate-binding domain-containing protein [Propionibacteriales bacterium]
RAVGVDLLVRDRRKVQLTEAGRQFLDDCHAILAVARQSGERARAIGHGLAGRVRVGFTSIATHALLPPLLRRLEIELPDLEVEALEAVSAVQFDHIRRGELDLGFVRPARLHEDLTWTSVHAEKLVAALPEGHRLAQDAGPLTPAQLGEEPLIGYSRIQNPYLAERFDALFVGTGRVTRLVNQVLTGIALVSEGFGLCVVPESATRIHMPGITFRDLEANPDLLRVEFWAVHARGNPNPAVRQVVEVATDEFASLFGKPSS